MAGPFALIPLAAAALGALVGKASQVYGNSVVDDANRFREKFKEAVELDKAEIKELRAKLLNRLISNAVLLRSAIGQEAILHGADIDKLPARMKIFFDELLGEESFAMPAPSDYAVWRFSPSEMHGMRFAVNQSGSHPLIAGTVMAVGMASKGVGHAFEASSYKKSIQADASEIAEKISRYSKALVNQYETLQDQWDSVIVPMLATKGAQREKTYQVLHAFADACELRARELLEL